MYKVIISPLAKQDIKDAAYWYNKKKDGLGKKFTLHVRQKVDVIKKTPNLFVTRYDEVKTVVLDVFPFMIHYTIDESKKQLIISAVLHTSRNPDVWQLESRS